ncbi:urea transporter [Amycolatopsis sp. NPDC051372]|uniref:urea transporter n=1 Tax=unclassified Amycolatopsis TaxID=2618356 RepID=UPI003426770A
MTVQARAGVYRLHSLDATMPSWSERADRHPAVAFADSCLRGVGQVCFMDNPVTGVLFLLALYLYTPWLGTATIVGVAAATVTAHLLGLDRVAIRAGLYGFNGTLVGAGFATFLSPPWHGAIFGYIIGGAAASTIVMAALTTILVPTWQAPPLTLAFNIVTLASLVAALGLAHGHAGTLLTPGTIQHPGPATGTALRSTVDSAGSYDVAALANALFRGVSQIFLANSLISGIVIIIGMTVCSRIAAGLVLAGSAVGGAIGIALGSDGYAIYHGLLGYNSCLTAAAIAGVFLVLSRRTFVLGIFGAVMSAVMSAVLAATLSVLFTPWGLPALTLPFCLATLAILLVKGHVTNLDAVPLDTLSTPEQHLRQGLTTPEQLRKQRAKPLPASRQ